MTENRQGTVSQVRLSPARDHLTITFESGVSYRFSAEYLRVMSPSAEVQGHGPNQRQLQPGKSWVTIEAIEPVGNYAIRLRFADGHSTGIFPWAFFADHGPDMDARFAAYRQELKAAGLSR